MVKEDMHSLDVFILPRQKMHIIVFLCLMANNNNMCGSCSINPPAKSSNCIYSGQACHVKDLYVGPGGKFMANASSFPYRLPFIMRMPHASSEDLVIHELDLSPADIASAVAVKGFHVAHSRIFPHNHAHALRDTMSYDLFAFRTFCKETWNASYIASNLHLLYLDGHQAKSRVYFVHSDNKVMQDNLKLWKNVHVFENVVIGRVGVPSPSRHFFSADDWNSMSEFISMRVLGYIPVRDRSLIWIANRDAGSSREWLDAESAASFMVENLGFNVSTTKPGTASLEEQVMLARKSSLIVGPHGSNLASMVLAGRDVSVLEILASDFLSWWYAQQAIFQSCRWASYPARTHLATTKGNGRVAYSAKHVAMYISNYFRSGDKDIQCQADGMHWSAETRTWITSDDDALRRISEQACSTA